MDTILTFLLGVAFWPLVITLFALAHMVISSDKDRLPLLPAILLGIILTGAYFKWPVVAGFASNIKAITILVGGYIAAGFIVTVVKYIIALLDFREISSEILAEHRKLYPKNCINLRDRVKTDIANKFDLFQSAIDFKFDPDNDEKACISLNWKEMPIVSWWCYWPIVVLAMPLDALIRLVKRLKEALRAFFVDLSRRFTVTG